jgi:hypothetical protein
MGAADSSSMLHFQKLDVYQRSIEFLALAHRIRERLPKGHAALADQLLDRIPCPGTSHT